MYPQLDFLKWFESNLFVGNSLIDMQAKCGSIDDAWMIFNWMCTCDVVSSNIMILGHAKCGQWQEALQIWINKCNRKGSSQTLSLLLGS